MVKCPAIEDHLLDVVGVLDVLERIALHQDDVRQLAGFDAARIQVQQLPPN